MKHLRTFENWDSLTKESFGMRRELCDRCHKPTGGTTAMSIFNLDVICMSCKEQEKQDPEYEAAVEMERQSVTSGDMNFGGALPNYKPIVKK